MELKPIATVPIDREVLLFWKNSGHIENGTVYDDGESEDGRYHVLFDGESLNVMPTHWAELPKFTFANT